MRISVLTLGTWGDLALFVGLGRELTRRGHHVVLGTSEFYASAVAAAGLEWSHVGQGSWAGMEAVLRAMGTIEGQAERTFAYYRHWLAPELAAGQGQIAALGSHADYFISNLKMVLRKGGRTMPGAAITYDPPASLADLARYGTQMHQGAILDLVALNRGLFDPDRAWGDAYHFTGFWAEGNPGDSAWQPPAELERFLDQGPPPVIVTLGSMIIDMRRFTAILGPALRLCGLRAVLVLGWSEPPVRDDLMALCVIREASYGWLFPRGVAVLHHGGYGTTVAALRAGRPSLILPRLGCQEQVGRALMQANLATGLFDPYALQPQELAHAIDRAMNDERVQESARTWQRIVLKEPGVRAAGNLIEAHQRGL
jgi:UDP:flavonoid glycosyltransferase YjiC (YdhE family)